MNFIIDPMSFINLDFDDNNNKQYGKGNNKKKKKHFQISLVLECQNSFM